MTFSERSDAHSTRRLAEQQKLANSKVRELLQLGDLLETFIKNGEIHVLAQVSDRLSGMLESPSYPEPVLETQEDLIEESETSSSIALPQKDGSLASLTSDPILSSKPKTDRLSHTLLENHKKESFKRTKT